MPRAVVYGMGQTGVSVARALLAHGYDVAAADDAEAGRERGRELGLEVAVEPDCDVLLEGADLLSPAPGLPLHHPVIGAARRAGVPAWSEFELAERWGHPPLVAVTGTNGKTTVCTLVEGMLAASGRRTVAAGNNDLPLVDALEQDLEVIVVEASSFRLDLTETFRPDVGTWLNVTEDHLDWHGTFDSYVAAKAKIWANQRPDDVAVANAEDAIVLEAATRAVSQTKTFGRNGGDARLDGATLVVEGAPLAETDELSRAWPHDISNALAAALTALAAGASRAACHDVLVAFRGLPHRVELIGDAGGVRFYDDSKATTPASVVTAVSGFDSVVLIAGGRNKGLDLGVMTAVADRVRAVVAIGDAAPEVEAAFAGRTPVTTASSMDDAVKLAVDRARAGDAVLLSPGCTSFDWYRSYKERGDDFARAARAIGAR